MDEDEQEGSLTGVLLLLPGCALMILEGPQRLVIGSLQSIYVSHDDDLTWDAEIEPSPLYYLLLLCHCPRTCRF